MRLFTKENNPRFFGSWLVKGTEPLLFRRGSRGGEMGEFSPPFFWASFFLFFSYPSIFEIIFDFSDIITGKNSPPISKSWIRPWKDSLAFLIESRDEWIISSGVSCMSVWQWLGWDRKRSATVVGLDFMLVLSAERLCSWNLSLRRRLVSPMYCKWQRLHCIL